jgi:hypothetical protein
MATKNSKRFKQSRKANGKKPYRPIITTKVATTCIITWPDIILAPRRIDKLTGRDRYEKNSMIKINGTSHQTTPCGTKIVKNFSLCLATDMQIVTMNTIAARANVTDMWLVVAKDRGIMPDRFTVTIKIKSEKIYLTIRLL